MIRIGALASAAVVTAAALVTANAQAPVPAQAPTAARVAFHLDVRAEDASGRLVRDLTASDFRVFENGKRQTLSSVSLVDLPIVRPAPGAQPAVQAVRDVASNLNGGVQGRSYVLFMYDNTLSEFSRPGVSAAFRTLAREFVEKQLMPGDLAGLAITPSTSRMPRSLTNDRQALLEAIDRIPSGVHVTENNESLEEKFAAVADYLRSAPGGGRRAIVTFMTTLGSYEVINRPSRTLFALRNTYRTDSEPKDWLLELMRATASANVVLYIVDPIGGRSEISGPLPLAGANRRVAEDNWRKDSRPELTGWTGGFAVTSADDLAGQFDRIVEDVSAYYFIDYDSSDQKADGKYRELRVEVDRPGVKVRTRLGYVAPSKN